MGSISSRGLRRRVIAAVLGLIAIVGVSYPIAKSRIPAFAAIGSGDAVASGSNPPIVFNASSAVHAGDVVSLQGHDFGSAPRVFLESARDTPLEMVNRVGTVWLGVRIPASARGALALRIDNGTGTSARVALDAARPHHLDAMQLVPGGAFRVFGRMLRSGASTPRVTIDGTPATIDLARSDEYMLTATAPSSLSSTRDAVVVVDNGNGSGPARLDRTIDVVAADGTDPFTLGVGWAAAFGSVAKNTIDAASDPRLADRVACDGRRDDSDAIRAAINVASSIGGGVVRLPEGRCRVLHGIELKSRVVLQGAGKAATELVYEADYPVSGVKVDLAGVRDLSLTNAGKVVEAPLVKDSSRVFLQNVRVRLGASKQMFLTGNRNFVVSNVDFEQTRSINQGGPYLLDDSAGLVFENNTTRWAIGSPTFRHAHDSYIHANRFLRDASAQGEGGSVHSAVLDFAYRIAVVGNTFDVVDGPITNKTRNDGETILTEAGGAGRTENVGTVGSATETTLSDPDNAFDADPFSAGAIPEDFGVAIVGGLGAGQTRRVVAVNGTTLTIDRPWQVVPDRTSRYATFVWGLEYALIKDNVLSNNPRGIWLYQSAIRDVAVVGNTMSEGGGIFLRAYQKLATKSFMPLYNVVVAGNRITNTTGHWMSYVNTTFANTDAQPFGIAMIGIEVRGNAVTANLPNVSSQVEDYANLEGYIGMMRVEVATNYRTPAVPPLLGTIFENNVCTNCDVALRLGTGAGGTTVLDANLLKSRLPFEDWPTVSNTEKSTLTIVRGGERRVQSRVSGEDRAPARAFDNDTKSDPGVRRGDNRAPSFSHETR